MQTVHSAINETLLHADIDDLHDFQGSLKDLSMDNYDRLKRSILKLGFSFAVHAWENDDGKLFILDGHQRLRTLKKMRDDGYTVPNIPVVMVKATDFKQAREKVLAGTSQFGQMTGEGLYEFIAESGLDWRDVVQDNRFPEVEFTSFAEEYYGEVNVDLPGNNPGEPNVIDDRYADKSNTTPLTQNFIVPPFSILDSRQGYWLDAKAKWMNEIDDQGESRQNTLTKGATEQTNFLATVNDGVSILDPVLAEVALKWFGLVGGTVFDPFAGDTVFGYVAKKTGHHFTGIELRKEQSDINQGRCDRIFKTKGSAKYCNDSSENIDKYIDDGTQDFLFSCPPYFDLEVYSDLPNDLSNQDSYEDFRKLITGILTNSTRKLKDNRFACIVISDVRDKAGAYRQMVMDIINIMGLAGLHFYNDMVLLNSPGTAPLRAGRYMRSRKVVRLHQNVLVFFKGDMSKIKEIYPQLVEVESETLPGEDQGRD